MSTIPDRPLPPAFADLQHFVADWALPHEQARYHRLHTAGFEALRTFYAAMLPRMPAIMEHLDRHTVGELPEPERTLFELAMTFSETAHPLDLGWKDVDFPMAYPWHKFEFRTVSAGQ